MKRLFLSIPGPMPVKVIIAVIAVAILLVALHFIYEWMGSTFLDTGGGVG
jgi:hypothetical protein